MESIAPEASTFKSAPIVVVGAGAAGMMAALFAARAGVRVLLLETRPKPGAKIRVSGGGRCNVLPTAVQLDDFHTNGSVHLLRNILFAWPLAAVRAFFEQDLGIPLRDEPTGKVFPVSERPLDIVEALLNASTRAGVELLGGFRVTSLDRGLNGGFDLQAEDGRCVHAEKVVLATGGLSLPKTGSDGAGLQMAERLGLALQPTYPALVPLTTDDARWKALAGVSVRARLRAIRDGRVVEERQRDALVTHRGFSGPVVLDQSYHWTRPLPTRPQLVVRWGGDTGPDWETELRPAGKRLVRTVIATHLPERLAELVLVLAGIDRERRESDLPRVERQALVDVLERYVLPVTGDEGYPTAEVTGGGVALAAVHSRSLECRTVPGLFVCGEMLDATGRIGGYNFLWAWVTGRIAGLGAATATSSAP